MTNSKIIVKVGKKSKIKFSHSKVYRAITSDSLFTLSNAVSDCHIVVIESINKDEEDTTRNFIQDFKSKDKHNIVLFYIPENDEITSGLADELEYNIFMSLEGLYKEIYNSCGINVSTFLKDKKELNKNNEYTIDGITDIFGDANEEFNKDIEDTIEQVDSGSISLEKLESTDESSNMAVSEINNEYDSENSLENIDITDENAILEISKLKMQLNDAKYDYSILQKDMIEAIARTEELEKIIKVLTDEKEVMRNTFDKIISTDIVMEDPISLAEYEGLKVELDSANNKVKELESHIVNLNETIQLNKETIDSNEETIKNIEDKLVEINASIDSGAIHKDIIDKYTQELEDTNAEKDKLSKEIEELKNNNANTEIRLEAAEKSLELTLKYRDTTAQLFKLAILKIKDKSEEIVELKSNIDELDVKLNSANEQLSNANNVIESNQEEILKLKTEIDTLKKEHESILEEKNTLEKRTELSNSYSEQEISKLSDKVSQLETKLKFTEEQLSIKENQYKSMIEQTTLKESSTQSLLDNNASLEQINKSLREKLSILSRESEQAKNENNTLRVQLEASKTQCKNLNEAVQALSGASGTGVSMLMDTTVKPIAYAGRAQIIPVFGSGSFGITTTAMSLAYKLCTTSRVLYMDLDLVSPRADSWFGKMPMISGIPGVQGNGLNDTGMGIFFNKGISVVSAYLDNIIIKGCEVTKGGGIDYISGCYARIEQSKISNADFTTLLSLLSTRYNYIVIDMGRLGNNETSDSLIKAITDISFRSIVVTTSDRFEVRDFKSKLVENKINLSKLAWLLNMCESTTVEDKVKQHISPIGFGIMLNDPSMRGNRVKFMKNKINKDKLDLFINSTVFGGK